MSVTSSTKKESSVGETIRVVIHALIIALVIRTFLFQPFNIPSGSMKATLLVGDYLFVSKYSYGYSHYSFPFSPPLFSGRIFGSQPNRGDIVVFRLPKDDSVDYIKRVIGLPGDRVRITGKRVWVNRLALGDAPADDGTASERIDGRQWLADWGDTEGAELDLTVPPGMVFVLGDNRGNSKDSRHFGSVPLRDVAGRARQVWFSMAPGGAVRWSRLGQAIH